MSLLCRDNGHRFPSYSSLETTMRTDFPASSSASSNESSNEISNESSSSSNDTNESHSSSAQLPFIDQERSLPFFFFACGIGSSLPYIATLSSLVYFEQLYGPGAFLDLNVAVYAPLLPISLAQARWDVYYDAQYASQTTYLVRGVLAFSLTLIGTLGLITPHQSLPWVFANALLQGTGGAVLYGTFNQMASFVGTNAKRSKASVSAGVQSSALFALAVSIVTGFGADHGDSFSRFVWITAAIQLSSFGAFLWLLLKRPTVRASMLRRDSSLRVFPDNLGQPLLEQTSDEEYLQASFSSLPDPASSAYSAVNHPYSNISNPLELSYSDIWNQSSSSCIVLAITLVPSFLVGSWFTRVHTDWMALAQILFFVRIASDFGGRLVTLWLPPASMKILAWTSLCRLFPIALFFINVSPSLSTSTEKDYLSIGLVSIIAFLSGYLVTGCFQLAPQAIPPSHREVNVSKQASLLTVVFSCSAILGLSISFLLSATL